MDFIYVKGELNKNLKKKQFGFDFNKVMQNYPLFTNHLFEKIYCNKLDVSHHCPKDAFLS